MKRIVIIVIMAALLVACKKTKFSPEGPTDIRIQNKTDQTFESITVTTTDDPAYEERAFTYGSVTSGSYTNYHRFDIAYPEAIITLTIGAVSYSTVIPEFRYLTYIGQDMVTYEITIQDEVNHVLKIKTTLEGPIENP
ncbi:MAG TPA: hypothetical protein VMV74_03455 [Bacteroidales bacterium]|nr:hypothetical protein [Bacteroidales bacterium]